MRKHGNITEPTWKRRKIAIEQWKNPITRERTIDGLKRSWTEKRKRIHRKRFIKNNPMKNPKTRSKTSMIFKKQFKEGRVVWNKGLPTEQQPFFNKKHKTNAKRLKDPEVQKKMMKARLIRPNKQEQIIINWVNEAKLPFKYVGNGTFFIGRKNPDFKHKTKKKVIEFNGFFRHTKAEEINRRRYFRNNDFGVLFLHKLDLKDKTNTIEKIKQFEMI